MDQRITECSSDLRKATLPKTCLISMVASRMHLNTGQMLRGSAKDSRKHGGGKLNSEVDRISKLHSKWTAKQVADDIGNTTADAVRHTQAWKNRH